MTDPDKYGSSRDDGRGYRSIDRNKGQDERNYDDRRSNPWGESSFKRHPSKDDSYYGNTEKRHRRDEEGPYRRERGSSLGRRDDVYQGNNATSHYDRKRSSSSSTYRNRVGDDWNSSEPKARDNCDDYDHGKQSERSHNQLAEVEEDGNDHNKGYESSQNPEVDEFGRKVIAGENLPLKGLKKPREWPPCFETHGQKYVLDTRSGMFYEAESDFFYDPKSKLYYGNKKQSYYRYNPDNRKHFEQVSSSDSNSNPALPVPNEADLAPDAILESVKPQVNVTSDQKTKSPAISITLKTKVIKTAATAIATNPVPEVATFQKGDEVLRVSKEHRSDIAKWAERQEEMRKTTIKSNRKPSEENSHLGVISKTAKGDPMCVICRRKFPSMEKLDYHIKVSALHKENLAKIGDKIVSVQVKAPSSTLAPPQDRVIAQPSSETSIKYVDRALQRRLMHGAEVSSIAIKIESSVDEPLEGGLLAQSSGTTTDVHPGHDLNEANIGTKMLQKLGWKGGSMLGGRAIDQDNDGASPLPPNIEGCLNGTIAKEWTRIESIASSNSNLNSSVARTHQQNRGGIGW